MYRAFHELAELFIGFIVRRPWSSMMIAVVLAAIVATGIGRAKPNFTHTAFFDAHDPMLKKFEAFERRFGNDDAIIVAVHSPSGVFDESTATLLVELTDAMWRVPEVIRVDSLANFQWVHTDEDEIVVEPLLPPDDTLRAAVLEQRRRIAMNDPVLPGYLVSKDGEVAVVYAQIQPGLERAPDSKAITDATRAVVASLERGDHDFHITGRIAVNNGFREASKADIITLAPIALLIALLVLALSLRRLAGALGAFVVVLLTLLVAFAAAGWLGVEYTTVTTILPQALIAIAIANTVHLFTHFYRYRRAGQDRGEAARRALRRNLVPTLTTSLTTAAGFFAFLGADLRPLSGFGLLAGIGAISSWLLAYLICGAAMAWLPSSTGAPLKPAARANWARRGARWVHESRHAILLGYGLIAVAAVVATANVQINSDPFRYFRADTELRKAQEFVSDALGGTVGYEVVVDSGTPSGVTDPDFLNRIDEFQTRVGAIAGVGKAVSLLTVLDQTNRALNGHAGVLPERPQTHEAIAQQLLLYTLSLPQGRDVNHLVSVEQDALRVRFMTDITDSETWMKTADRIETIGAELGLDAQVTGKMALYQGMHRYVVTTFVESVLVALLLISLLLAVFLRSAGLGVLALVPNIVPVVGGGAFLYLIDAPLDLGTALVASVCLGIAVDDTVHVMIAYRRGRDAGCTPERAVARIYEGTAPALATTTLVLVAAFGSLVFGTFVPNIMFGLVSAVVLTAALVTDLVVLPALLITVDGIRGRTGPIGVVAVTVAVAAFGCTGMSLPETERDPELISGLANAEQFRQELLERDDDRPSAATALADAIARLAPKELGPASSDDPDYYLRWMSGVSAGTVEAPLFESFSGRWEGTWRTMEVEHDWEEASWFPTPLHTDDSHSSPRLLALQYATVGDGYGWNAVIAPRGHVREVVVLGTVKHVRPRRSYVVPHVGIPTGEGLVWITPTELFFEVVSETPTGRLYQITRWRYEIDEQGAAVTTDRYTTAYGRWLPVVAPLPSPSTSIDVVRARAQRSAGTQNFPCVPRTAQLSPSMSQSRFVSHADVQNGSLPLRRAQIRLSHWI